MPDKNDSHGEFKTIFDNDDWLIVEPMDYDSFIYYAPPSIKSKWDEFRDGNTYFIIDKDKEPIQIYVIHKGPDNEILYLGSEAMRYRLIDRKELFYELPDEVKSELEPIIGYSPIYELLVKVKNGEPVSSNEMEGADDLVYKFNYNEKNPGKSTIKLRFDEISDYVKLFQVEEEDVYYVDRLFSYYGDTYDYVDYNIAADDWHGGYFFGWFSDENKGKLKQILKYISPDLILLDDDDKKEVAAQKLMEMFEGKIENILEEYVDLENGCRHDDAKKQIKDEICEIFQNYGLINIDCFRTYYTTVGLLLSMFKISQDPTKDIKGVLTDIGHTFNTGGWDEYRYEIQCDDFDEERLNIVIGEELDEILEELEESDKYVDILEYSNIYDRVVSKYPTNTRSKTSYGREFFIREIDPETNRIHMDVFTKTGVARRSYTEEEFNNFLVSPELFEGFVRIN
jgi:transposase-like protein